MNASMHCPHKALARDDRERFAADLFDRFWEQYRERVSYVKAYEQMLTARNATFFNDHIAFRTFACQQPLNGIATISRIFEALGYRAAGVYHFEDKHLSAAHYQHANPQFPKLFISELKTWELGDASQRIIKYAAKHRSPFAQASLERLSRWPKMSESERAELLQTVLDQFHELPWPTPDKDDVVELNKISQYAAWVLVHGYNVNHFTSLVNSHGVESLDDLEKTISALQEAGVPMKAEIEGEAGSKLRQSATEAVMIDVDVLEQGRKSRLPWTYAYFELAERNTVIDPSSGKRVRFEGFLGPQATNLFEMTRVK